MGSASITILVLHGLAMMELGAVPVGIIRNASLHILNGNTTVITGTCEACVCSLLTQPTFFSLNCRSNHLICELYSVSDQNKAFTVLTDVNSSFYFLSLPTYTTSQAVIVEYLWPFDSTFDDTSSTFIGAPFNNPTLSPSTITGYGASLSLVGTSTQSVFVSQPFLRLYNQSWTFEAWIYLASLVDWLDYAIIQQPDSPTPDKALHLTVRYCKLHLGFYSDDLEGISNLTVSRWYHAAFVFDSVTRNQSVYLDGILDASRIANSPYLGMNGSLNIGVTHWSSFDTNFDGLIDQLSFTNRTKTSDEILRDATLTLYFSFDGNSTYDQGPLRVNGCFNGSTSLVSGRRSQALQIDNVLDSYFTVQGLFLLGRNNQSYSFSIWIKPNATRSSSIIHMSSVSNGTGWCMPMIGLSNTSRLIATSWNGAVVRVEGPIVIASTWTLAVATYSPSSGLRLYVNGSLFNNSSPFSFQASGSPNYLFIGSPRSGTGCRPLVDINGQYSGVVDELQVYSRELTAPEINALATL